MRWQMLGIEMLKYGAAHLLATQIFSLTPTSAMLFTAGKKPEHSLSIATIMRRAGAALLTVAT